MRALLLLVTVSWLWAATALAQPDEGRSVLTVVLADGGNWQVRVHLDGGVVTSWPEQDERFWSEQEKYVRQHLQSEWLGQLFAAADAGVAPARWQAGYFLLNGWYGVPVDVTTGERLLWQAPVSERGVVMLALAEQALASRDDDRAERLFIEAWDAGVDEARWRLCVLARNTARSQDPAHLDQLLTRLWAHGGDRSFSCRLARAELRVRQKRFDEAYDLATAAWERTHSNPQLMHRAWHLRIEAGVRSGRLSRMTADELSALFLDRLPASTRSVVWSSALVAVALVLLLTWVLRTRPMGFWFASFWVSLPLSLNSLGLLVPPVKGPLGWWSGVILSAVVCLAALRFRSTPTLYGAVATPIARREVFLVGAMMAAMASVSFAWSSVQLALLGSEPTQTVVGLLRVSGPVDLFWTLLFAAGLVPWVEEVCFRGFLYDGLERRWGVRAAVAGSTVLFGLAHIEMQSVVPNLMLTGFIGLLLALLRQRTGDLRLSFALHALNNALSVIMIWSS